MDNTVIKNLIYNQLFAAANYDLIATIAPDDPTKTRILNFSADCKNNANFQLSSNCSKTTISWQFY